ncbi:cupredoxin domain-containing protein [Ferrimonas gelatinilytica]|uniref:Cupredoxin domain-containing protein n=1 Tax=Ferrimonas gelatinilytica TaxID=1255257 RepID=A0ABP9SD17_9GAMM
MLFINLAGLALIAGILWWFWLYKPKAETGGDALTITVENGVYHPARIQLPAGAPATLLFMRKDPAPCSETVLFPQLEISETLPLNRPKAIPLPAMPPGEYDFHCQMQMYKGQILVLDQST